ncbi:BMC domain-containing protein [Melghirimyces profundicolus]|uniref:BMC domain-containing protein n=1 Tax=Melghirimyces profundicolus TaxID=1242148 RepID=A0A2T6C8K9_9BACL|nr:BMC domain-containing protein [Melghirimyces profundicolus]PTX64645.1 BMC domain-containing protein [Melghirimyces profundicolus]
MKERALGLIEMTGFTATLITADTALKTADVRLSRFEWIGGGRVTIVLTGEVASVAEAVKHGVTRGKELGEVLQWTVIPRMEELQSMLRPGGSLPVNQSSPGKDRQTSTSSQEESGKSGEKELQLTPDSDINGNSGEWRTLSVKELRKKARRLPGFNLPGKEISRANRKRLVSAMEQYFNERSVT